ncbi:MAG TPA: hypothetical protein DCW90_01430, partial [Lachnospiraceae bacterium]|nr:hypothetical protein [Lachnospiraceae bacterium]
MESVDLTRSCREISTERLRKWIRTGYGRRFMASVKWTMEQQKVIDSRDRNILVSAAAGSGKTAVLVERIIQ